jgi:copper chaperone
MGEIRLKVEDMTCGHCAGAVTKAVEGAVPGAKVAADPASKLVTVTGAGDAAKVEAAIRAAGYTPQAA